jgi:hypothetical protein
VSWSILINAGKRVSYAVLTGVVTVDDFIGVQQQLAHDPALDPTFPLMIDLRAADDLRLTWAELQELIASSPLLRSTRRAIVVDALNTPVSARVSAMARENEQANYATRVFRSFEDAAAWLGVEA